MPRELHSMLGPYLNQLEEQLKPNPESDSTPRTASGQTDGYGA
jgi:hypothetical protein